MVLLKVIEVSAQRQYASLGAKFQPMNLIYKVDISPAQYVEDENGNIIVQAVGLETIFKFVLDVVNEKPKTTDF